MHKVKVYTSDGDVHEYECTYLIDAERSAQTKLKLGMKIYRGAGRVYIYPPHAITKIEIKDDFRS